MVRKFPELGSIGLVYRIAAMLSLRRYGFLSERPIDIDSSSDHPVRLPGVIEMSDSNRALLLFPTIIQLLAERPLDLEEIYEQVWFHIHLGTKHLSAIAAQSLDFDGFFAALTEEIPPGLDRQTVRVHSKEAATAGSGLLLGSDREDNEGSAYLIPKHPLNMTILYTVGGI